MRQLLVLATAALVATAASAQAQVASPAAAPATVSPAQVFATLSDAEVEERVEAVMARVIARPEAVGLSVAVARGDKVIVERGAGLADLASNRRADAVTEFRIGSVTKQFTAAAIMKLLEQGKVGLDDPLAKYLPDFDTGGRTVTIRQLLNHASGIPNYTAQPGFGAIAAKPDLTAQDVLALVRGVPFDFEPGTGWRYSNTNYYLLGLIIEKVSGRPYGDFVRDQFFKPLGLTRTRYDSGDASVADRASGYAFDPATNARRPADPLSMTGPFAAGAIASTAGDLLRWQIALTGGRAVSAASFQQMSGSTVKIGQGDAAYGFGLMLDRIGGMRRVWHNGGINGFNSILTWWPDLGLRTAVISNSEGLPSEAVEQMIVAALTSDKPLPPARTTPQPGSEPALRAEILAMAAGAPDYAAMTPQMAEVVRGQAATLQPMFQKLGPLQSLTFRSVDLNGVDQYLAQFANGVLLFSIALDPQGKIGGSWFRAIAKP